MVYLPEERIVQVGPPPPLPHADGPVQDQDVAGSPVRHEAEGWWAMDGSVGVVVLLLNIGVDNFYWWLIIT